VTDEQPLATTRVCWCQVHDELQLAREAVRELRSRCRSGPWRQPRGQRPERPALRTLALGFPHDESGSPSVRLPSPVGWWHVRHLLVALLRLKCPVSQRFLAQAPGGGAGIGAQAGATGRSAAVGQHRPPCGGGIQVKGKMWSTDCGARLELRRGAPLRTSGVRPGACSVSRVVKQRLLCVTCVLNAPNSRWPGATSYLPSSSKYPAGGSSSRPPATSSRGNTPTRPGGGYAPPRPPAGGQAGSRTQSPGYVRPRGSAPASAASSPRAGSAPRFDPTEYVRQKRERELAAATARGAVFGGGGAGSRGATPPRSRASSVAASPAQSRPGSRGRSGSAGGDGGGAVGGSRQGSVGRQQGGQPAAAAASPASTAGRGGWSQPAAQPAWGSSGVWWWAGSSGRYTASCGLVSPHQGRQQGSVRTTIALMFAG
jgi:hypothetical protein